MKTNLTFIYAKDGNNIRETYTQNFLVDGPTDYKHNDMKLTATEIAQALARWLPESTLCVRVLSNGADDHGNSITGQSTTFLMDIPGTFEVPVGSAMANMEETLVLFKKATIGRVAYTHIRNVWTTDELNAYWEGGDLPARFTAAFAVGAGPNARTVDLLSVAGADQGHFLCLPDYYLGVNHGSRPLTDIEVQGWAHKQLKQQKQSDEQARIRAAKITVNKLAAKARKVKRLDPNGPLPDWTDIVVADLTVQARAVVAPLTSYERASVGWPAGLDSYAV